VWKPALASPPTFFGQSPAKAGVDKKSWNQGILSMHDLRESDDG
jgi:hypothetical protein